MSSLKQLSAHQLNKMLIETRDELKRRENIDKALKDIHAVLKKYNITIDDIDLGKAAKKSASKKATTKKSAAKSWNKKSGVGTKNTLPKPYANVTSALTLPRNIIIQQPAINGLVEGVHRFG